MKSPLYLAERDGKYAIFAADPKDPEKGRIYLRPSTTSRSIEAQGRKIMGYATSSPKEFESPMNYVFLVSPADVLVCLSQC